MNRREAIARAQSSITLLLVACLFIAVAGVDARGAIVQKEPAQKEPAQKADSSKPAKTYVCPMDPDVSSKEPGTCPKCGMALRVKEAAPLDAMTNSGGPVSGLTKIPNTPVYDQNGNKLRFYSDLVKGKTVAINFIFTTCTTICPPLTATFRKVQYDLGERVGKDIHLISISVDPATDVPERLKSFSEKFKAGPGWTFVTGNKQDIDGLLLALGASVADKNDHTPMILVGNERAANWTRTYGLATPQTLVKVITDAAEPNRVSRSSDSDATVEVPVPGTENAPARAVSVGAKMPDAKTVPAKTPAKTAKSAGDTAASYFPNTELLTQDNKPVHFFDDLLKGKVVMINFAFTTCAGVCSPMTANLAKVQEYLGDRVGRDINMITISVDPLVDTPDVLKKYAAGFKVKPGWYFLTGKKDNVDQVLKKLGGYVTEKDKHSGVLIIGNVATGDWSKVFAMANPSEIASQVRKIADAKP